MAIMHSVPEWEKDAHTTASGELCRCRPTPGVDVLEENPNEHDPVLNDDVEPTGVLDEDGEPTGDFYTSMREPTGEFHTSILVEQRVMRHMPLSDPPDDRDSSERRYDGDDE